MLDKIVDICSQLNPRDCLPWYEYLCDRFIVWGAIGPRRLFNPGAPYCSLPFFYFLAHHFPFSFYRYITSAGGCDPITPSRLLSIQGMPSPFSQYSSHWARLNQESYNLIGGATHKLRQLFHRTSPNISVSFKTRDAQFLGFRSLPESGVIRPWAWLQDIEQSLAWLNCNSQSSSDLTSPLYLLFLRSLVWTSLTYISMNAITIHSHNRMAWVALGHSAMSSMAFIRTMKRYHYGL